MGFSRDEYYQEIMVKNRQQMIDVLCQTGYITDLSAEQQGNYLFGTTKNDRAVCLIWNNDNDGCITLDILRKTYHEIARSGFNVPFLFFGCSSLVVDRDLFTFAQIPWIFEHNGNSVLRTLQGMNMRGNLHLPVLHPQTDGTQKS